MKTIIPGTSNYGKRPRKINLYAKRFDSFSYKFNHKIEVDSETVIADLDSINHLAQVQIKQSNKYDAKILKTVPVKIDSTKDEIEIYFEAGQLDLIEGKYYYDVELLYNDERKTILEGIFIVLPQVTDWKDLYTLRNDVTFTTNYNYDIIVANQQITSIITNFIEYQIDYAQKFQSRINSDISIEIIPHLLENMRTFNWLKSTIEYEFTPILLNSLCQLSGEFDYVKDINADQSITIGRQIEYEIY